MVKNVLTVQQVLCVHRLMSTTLHTEWHMTMISIVQGRIQQKGSLSPLPVKGIFLYPKVWHEFVF